jgi:DNA polymerase-3 subunit beta
LLIQVNRDLFLDSIQIVNRAVSNRTIVPSLAGILLEASSDRVRLTGNDLEISITTEMSCRVFEPGEAVVPARLLTETVRRSPEGNITLRAVAERNTIQLINEPMQMEILTLAVDEFPETASFDAEQSYIISQDMAKNMIRQVYFAISREELRPILTGSLWSFEGSQLKMKALDGYRLACRWASLSQAGNDREVVVPGKTLRELMRLLSDQDKELTVSIGRNFISFEFEGVVLTSRLLEGKFPNTDQFMPKAYQTRVVVNTEQLISSVERAALVSKEGQDGSVKLTVEGDRLAVSAQSMDIGRHFEQLPVEKSGEDLQIMFNIKALVEMLSSAGSEEVALDFHGSFGPGVMRPVGQEEFTALLMPVRLS